MPATIYHAYTQTVPDSTATSLVRPSDWNSVHLITLAPTGQEIIGAFSNGGNVTFGTNPSGYVTATAPAGGGAGDGGNVIAAGGSTNASTGTVVFGNGNNVSFGLNAGTVTASASFAAQTQQPMYFSASGTNTSANTLQFGNTQGVSFSLSNGSLVATVKTDYQSSNANYLTSQSNQAFSASGGSSAFQTLGFSNQNGVTFTNTNGSVGITHDLQYTSNTSNITANAFPTANTTNLAPSSVSSRVVGIVAATNNTGGGTATQSGNVSFSNANGATFYTSAGGAVALSYTVPTQSVDTNKAGTGFTSTTTNGTAVVGTLNTNGLSLGIPLYQTAAGAGDGNNVLGVNANATSASTTYILSNANNVSFGLNAGTITASASFAGGAVTGISGIIASNTTYTSGTVSFADGNGVSFGTGVGQALSITHGLQYTSNTSNITSNAFATSNSSLLAVSSVASRVVGIVAATNNTGGGTATQSGNVSFSNANGATFYSSGGGAVALSYSVPTVPTAYVSSVNGSSGAISLNAGSSLSASTNGSSITFGLASNWSTTIMPLGNSTGYASSVLSNTFLTTAMASNAGSNFVAATAAFAGTNASGTIASNGISVSVAAGGGVTSGNIYASGNTTQSTSNTVALSSLVFEGAGIASVGVSNNRVLVSVPSGGGAGDGVNIVQAGTTGTTGTTWSSISATVQINGSNGIVVSQNNSNQIVISYSGTNDFEFLSAMGNTVGTNTFAPGNTLYLAGGNGVTLSGNGSTLSINVNTNPDGWSILGNTAGASNTYQWTNDTIYLAGGNNITLSQNGSTITIVGAAGGAGQPASYWANIPTLQGSTTLLVNASTSHVAPLVIPEDLSINFMRMIVSGNILAASTTAATTGNTQFSCGYTKSHNFVFYTRGNGANSSSLGSYFSTQVTEAFSNNISCATNSTQFSYSNRYTMPHITGTVGFTQDYSSSAASINVNSASATAFTALKQVDFPMATSFSAGMYWLAYGQTSSTATQVAGTTIGLRNAVTFNVVGVSQPNVSIGTLGAATNSTVGYQFGLGSFTTNATTTASINMINISSSSAHAIPYYQLMRIT